MYLINRYYAPQLGQFISVDPDVSATGLSYAYGNNDPVRDIDPSGDAASDESYAYTPGQSRASSPNTTKEPNCGKGVSARKLLDKYKTMAFYRSGYRTDYLYCGNNDPVRWYGYRHLKPHVGQYFGGWNSYNFAIRTTLISPAVMIPQANGNFNISAPQYQCFYAGYYYLWTFYVLAKISSGAIVTAYGHKVEKVNRSCP
jgi:uncharacterized protein RhaS with RHS repeats